MTRANATTPAAPLLAVCIAAALSACSTTGSSRDEPAMKTTTRTGTFTASGRESVPAAAIPDPAGTSTASGREPSAMKTSAPAGTAVSGAGTGHQTASLPAPADLDFSRLEGEKKSFDLNGQTVHYRAFENIVYVLKPVDTRYQTLNVYIPESYFAGGEVDGFNTQNAPIFLPNDVGGYMPATAMTPALNARANNTPNAIMVALSKGYVVASPGARGRTGQEASGRYNGKAPGAIVDLKAAVRYLKANDRTMPGDAEKIISNGTSAGGALSALLGTSGDSPDYAPYLRALGAADASDRIFAVSAYCPITNLEHADMAYEWQFHGVNDYKKIDMRNIDYRAERKLIEGTQTAAQIALSDQLKPLFPAYVNGLRLKDANGRPLTLDADGRGSFRTWMEARLLESAQQALDAGTDLSGQSSWLTVKDGKAVAADFAAYARFVGRQKTTPAFDAVDLSSGENQLFGDAHTDKRHFTAFGQANSTVSDAQLADGHTVKLMNAMNYIGKGGARHYRIRVGENDRDTSLAISAMLALKLQNHGKRVDYALPWGVPHSGDYDLDELFAWMKETAGRR